MKLLTLSLSLSSRFVFYSFSLPYWSAGKKKRWHFLEWYNPNRRSRDSRHSSRFFNWAPRAVRRWRKQHSYIGHCSRRTTVERSRCPNRNNSWDLREIELTLFGPSLVSVRWQKNMFESRCFEQRSIDYLVVFPSQKRFFLLSSPKKKQQSTIQN